MVVRQNASHFDWEPTPNRELAWVYMNMHPDILATHVQLLGIDVTCSDVCQYFTERRNDSNAHSDYYEIWKDDISNISNVKRRISSGSSCESLG